MTGYGTFYLYHGLDLGAVPLASLIKTQPDYGSLLLLMR